MANFRVHMFEEIRMTYLIEGASSMQEAVATLMANLDEHNPIESELTGDYSNDVCVDPVLENGVVDTVNYQWLKIEEEKPTASAIDA